MVWTWCRCCGKWSNGLNYVFFDGFVPVGDTSACDQCVIYRVQMAQQALNLPRATLRGADPDKASNKILGAVVAEWHTANKPALSRVVQALAVQGVTGGSSGITLHELHVVVNMMALGILAWRSCTLGVANELLAAPVRKKLELTVMLVSNRFKSGANPLFIPPEMWRMILGFVKHPV